MFCWTFLEAIKKTRPQLSKPSPLKKKVVLLRPLGDIHVARSSETFSPHLTFQLTASTSKTTVGNLDITPSWLPAVSLPTPQSPLPSCADQLLNVGVPQDFISYYIFSSSNLICPQDLKYHFCKQL